MKFEPFGPSGGIVDPADTPYLHSTKYWAPLKLGVLRTSASTLY
jgi:hypothetical protein